MKNEYVISFLSSPPNPALDDWIGQNYFLSYLNSQPGSSYLFAFRPFELLPSRAKQENRFAQVVVGEGVTQGHTNHFFIRNDRVGTDTKRYENRNKAILKHFEAMGQHGFEMVVKELHSMVKYIQILSNLFIKESNVNWDAVPTAIVPDKWDRSAIEEISYQIATRPDFFQDAMQTLRFLADSPRLNRESVQIAKAITSYMHNFREGRTVSISLPDRTNTKHESYRGMYIVTDLVQSPSVVDPGRITAIRRDRISIHQDELQIAFREEKIGSELHIYKNASEPDKHAIGITRYIVGHDVVNEGHQQDFYRIGRETDRILYKNIGFLNAVQLDQEGYKDIGYLNAFSYDRTGYLTNAKRLFDRSHNTQAQVSYNLQRGSRYNKVVFVYQELQCGEWSGREARNDFPRILSGNDIGSEAGLLNPDLFATHHPRESDRLKTTGLLGEEYASQATITYELYRFNTYGQDADITHLMPNLQAEHHGKESQNIGISYDVMVNKLEKDFRFEDRVRLFMGKIEKNGMVGKYTSAVLDIQKKINEARIQNWSFLVEYQPTDALVGRFEYGVHQVGKDVSVLDHRPVLANELASAASSWVLNKNANQIPHLSRYKWVDHTAANIPLDATIYSEIQKRSDKVKLESWLIHQLNTFSRVEKASIITGLWDLLRKVSKHFLDLNRYVEDKKAEMEKNDGKDLDAFVQRVSGEMVKQQKEFEWVTQAVAESPHLDVIIQELLDFGERTDFIKDAIERQVAVADNPDKSDRASHTVDLTKFDKIEARGIIEDAILSYHQQRLERPATALYTNYVLMQDDSEWEDIYIRYSPGKDIIDVPNSDYDYEKLSAQVYNPETGVPFRPMSPLNVPDVKIKTPLNHPLPLYSEIGQNEVIVDNYVIIDVILSIHSLMNQNKLRYAGTAAGEAVREIMSKLFSWIQSANPANPEYDRMYRFTRWYAEMCVLKLSDHILKRVYAPWQSQIHLNGDLGIPYTSAGWVYSPAESVIKTTGTFCTLQFSKENYIDGQITIRGYLDNPASQGKIDVYIDGVKRDTITTHGAFTLNYEMPMGKHTYIMSFDGMTGQAYLSSLEITGAVFVSAHTISDDSNTNGLKAITMLIQNLVAYYDQHHADGKVKGMMELKQRKVILNN